MMVHTQRKITMPKINCYVRPDCVRWVNDKGLFHREDGPAIEHANGNKDWCLNGRPYTEKEYNDKIKTLRET